MADTEPREWFEFNGRIGEKETIISVDVTFLMSGYHCIWGCGCPGAWGASDKVNGHILGCCNTGPDFAEDDIPRISALIHRLDPSRVDSYDRIVTQGWWYQQGDLKKNGRLLARRADDHCIFLNTGKKDTAPMGCSLHVAAIDNNERPIDWKPSACWMLPLWAEWDDEGRYIVSYWDSDNNGSWQGRETGWWCLEAPEAYTGDVPVYVTYAEELSELIGEINYKVVRDYLDSRKGFRTQPIGTPVSFRPSTREATET